MSLFKTSLGTALLTGLLALSSSAFGAERQPDQKTQKLKPYPLKTCLVTDEKLGEMGDPFVHKYQDREIKFCCKGCLKDFNKAPAKYIKKLETAEKAEKNAKPAPAK
jgi:hypothetical protein